MEGSGVVEDDGFCNNGSVTLSIGSIRSDTVPVETTSGTAATTNLFVSVWLLSIGMVFDDDDNNAAVVIVVDKIGVSELVVTIAST